MIKLSYFCETEEVRFDYVVFFLCAGHARRDGFRGGAGGNAFPRLAGRGHSHHLLRHPPAGLGGQHDVRQTRRQAHGFATINEGAPPQGLG